MISNKTGPEKAGETSSPYNSLDEKAANELLMMGDGQLAYVRPVEVQAGAGVGVFSARGELIAVCGSMQAAVAHAFEQGLVLVARQ